MRKSAKILFVDTHCNMLKIYEIACIYSLAPMQGNRSRTMKQQIIIFFFCLILFNGFGQELKSLKEVDLDSFEKAELTLTQGWNINITPDKEWIFHKIQFSKDDKIQLTDSVDLAADGFNIRLWELNESQDYILAIECIYEYVSYYPIYLIKHKDITKIGALNIRLDCENCDALNYPLSDFVVKANTDFIEFSFLQDLVLMNQKGFPKFKHDEIQFIYEFETEEFKINMESRERNAFNLFQDFELNKSKFTADTFNLTDISTEGGELTVFHTSDREYLVFDIWIFGEMGKKNTTYWTDKHFDFKLVREWNFEYDRPMYIKDYKITETVRYFVHSDTSVAVYNQEKIKIENHSQGEKGKELKEFFNSITSNIEIVK